MIKFSWQQRKEWLASPEEYDLLIIGGGITGAGILLDAQSRGLKAFLVEMQDFAAGTSSRSTKLIHGGLRYLKNMEFGLVAEVGRERAIVYENGPHVTKAEPMLIPIIRNGSLGKMATSLGVWMYDRLARVHSKERRKVLSAAETAQAEPLLDKNILQAGILYYEYRTDDSRLTMEILKKGVELGGRPVNYTELTRFVYENNKVKGGVVKDLISGTETTIRAKYIVNATGPWVDKLMEMDDPSKAGKLFVTKGVHLVVEHHKLPVKQSAYFDAPDGRMIFVIPREGKTYLGTTDTPYNGDIRNPAILEEDITYLITAVNRIFKGVSLKESDVISGWAGLRPLIREEGKSPSEISRKDEIFVNASGLISIAGGKLTGFRKMSQKILDLVAAKMQKEGGLRLANCRTEHIKMSGGEVGGAAGFSAFVQRAVKDGIKAGLTDEEAHTIARIYGSNSVHLYRLVAERKQEAAEAGLPLGVFARLAYALDQELLIAPTDFFIRRTSMLYFHPEELIMYKEKIIQWMKKTLQWPLAVENLFYEDLELQINLDTHFK